MADGQYKFHIKKSEYKSSQAGNDMMALQVVVVDHEGHDHTLFENLLPSFESHMEKLKVLSEIKGFEEKYDTGELVGDEPEGARGLVDVRTKDGKNVIARYIKSADSTISNAVNDFHDDALPF